jgi:hypothetical protein
MTSLVIRALGDILYFAAWWVMPEIIAFLMVWASVGLPL